jgi:chemotaxis protein histidine kinase CheA
MDDLLSEFLVETSNRLVKLDGDIARFATEPGNGATQAALADLFHTMTSASGFLALNRLEAISQSVEDLLDRMQNGTVAVSPAAGDVVVEAIDVIRRILRTLATGGAEPPGDDMDLMVRLLAARAASPGAEAPSAPKDISSSEPAETSPRQDEKPGGVSATIEVQETSPVALPVVASNVSVPLERLESFAGLVGQLVQTRNNLNYLMRDRDDAELEDSIQRLSHITSDLGNNIVATRRQALGQVFGVTAGETQGSFDIVTAVTVSCGGRRFAIPQRSVLELVWVTPSAGMGTANDEFRYLRLRDGRHPWIRLSTILQTDMDRALARRREIVIMMQAGDEMIGLSVEQVFDAEEIVMRPQPPLLAGISLYLGNTILGDGSVAMVLDPQGILAELRSRQQRLIGERAASAALPSVQK